MELKMILCVYLAFTTIAMQDSLIEIDKIVDENLNNKKLDQQLLDENLNIKDLDQPLLDVSLNMNELNQPLQQNLQENQSLLSMIRDKFCRVTKKFLKLQSVKNVQIMYDENVLGVTQAKDQADEIQNTLKKLEFYYEQQRKMEMNNRLKAWPQVWGQKVFNSQFIMLNIAMFLLPSENYEAFFRCNSSIRKISQVYFERTNLNSVFRIWRTKDPYYYSDLSRGCRASDMHKSFRCYVAKLTHEFSYYTLFYPISGQTVQIMNFPGYGSPLFLGKANLFEFHGSLTIDVLVLFRIKSEMFRFVNVSIQNNAIFLHYETEVYKSGLRRKKHSTLGSYVWFGNTTIEIPLIWNAGEFIKFQSHTIDESHIIFSYAKLPYRHSSRLDPILRQRFTGIHDQHLQITKKLVLQMKIVKE